MLILLYSIFDFVITLMDLISHHQKDSIQVNVCKLTFFFGLHSNINKRHNSLQSPHMSVGLVGLQEKFLVHDYLTKHKTFLAALQQIIIAMKHNINKNVLFLEYGAVLATSHM